VFQEDLWKVAFPVGTEVYCFCGIWLQHQSYCFHW